jgi:UDP-N-acetylglucosamine:LPS N-acetylglucosamine transferase
MKILFTGGGTGGHIFPLVAVLKEIKKISSKEPIEFYYIKIIFKIIFFAKELR